MWSIVGMYTRKRPGSATWLVMRAPFLPDGFFGFSPPPALPGLQLLENQWGPPRGGVPAVMPAMRPMAVPAAAVKSSAPAVSAAVASAIPAIRPSAAVAPTESTAIASAALRPLETRTRVGADAREILARRAGVARPTRFTGQQNHVFFHRAFDRRAF